MIARIHALRLRAITDDLPILAEHLGVRTILLPMPLWLCEMYLPIDSIAVVNARLIASRRRWYWAHSLGHAALHCGDHAFLSVNCIGVVAKQEEQANRFAAFFLAPTLAQIGNLPADKRAYRVWLEGVCGARAA